MLLSKLMVQIVESMHLQNCTTGWARLLSSLCQEEPCHPVLSHLPGIILHWTLHLKNWIHMPIGLTGNSELHPHNSNHTFLLLYLTTLGQWQPVQWKTLSHSEASLQTQTQTPPTPTVTQVLMILSLFQPLLLSEPLKPMALQRISMSWWIHFPQREHSQPKDQNHPVPPPSILKNTKAQWMMKRMYLWTLWHLPAGHLCWWEDLIHPQKKFLSWKSSPGWAQILQRPSQSSLKSYLAPLLLTIREHLGRTILAG